MKYYVGQLNQLYPPEESRSLMFILFEHYFELDKLAYTKEPDRRISESEMLKIHFAVKDLLKHKPVQHITGKAFFLELELHVNENVLIPRPETEQLLQIIFEKNNQIKDDTLKMMDIGTGSGCISLSLKNHFSNAEVHAIDYSELALETAIRNASENDLEVSFIKMDILNESDTNSLSNYDLIVSNPPYVRNSEKEMMRENVLNYEPDGALFVSDEDPLVFYRSIAKLAWSKMNKGGSLYFEINEYLGNETRALVEELGFADVELIQDYFKKDRFISALKK